LGDGDVRAVLAFISVFLLFASATAADYEPALDAYAKPDRLVEISKAGRRIHMRCMGEHQDESAPTVILAAGLGAWSATWGKVQPAMAKTTRVCAIDRAGFGHSDATIAPQTLKSTVSDYHAALVTAGITPPYIFVGHSLAGLEALEFIDRYRTEVVGAVLVDPMRPDEYRRMETVAPDLAQADRDFVAGEVKRLRDCASGLDKGTIKGGAPNEGECFRYFPEYSPALQSVLAKLDSSAPRLRTQASLYEQYESNTYRIVKRDRDYGDLPLIILTATKGQAWPDELQKSVPAMNADAAYGHRTMAKRLTTRGEQRKVEAGHMIQLEQPAAVITAVEDVARMAQAPAK
jgi:pimeloyl-ACP methyl ester carboxylesterase